MTKSTFLMMFLMLTACSTSYQEMGLTGGVTSQRIYNNTYRIKARGNGWTDMAKIQDFVLLKSAELALANNATHFTLAGSADATRRSYITTPTTHNTTVSSYGRHSGAYQRNIGGGTYDGIYSGSARINTTTNHGSIIPVIKPGMDVFVTIFKIPTNRTPQPNMINAQGIYNSIAPRLIKQPPLK